MLYLVAILIPPLALLFCGKPFQAVFSLAIWITAWVLWIFGAGILIWLVLAAHAVMVVRDNNTRKMMEDIAARKE